MSTHDTLRQTPQDYLRPRQIVERYGASESTVRRWIASGTVDAIRVNGAASSPPIPLTGCSGASVEPVTAPVAGGAQRPVRHRGVRGRGLRRHTQVNRGAGLAVRAHQPRPHRPCPGPAPAAVRRPRVTSGGPHEGPPPMHPTDLTQGSR